MARPKTTLCWPTNFLSKWLATFFAAALVGVLLGLLLYKPQPVRLYFLAYQADADGRPIVDSHNQAKLIPAAVEFAGSGPEAEPGSDQPPLSVDRNHLTYLTRPPGFKMWMVFKWKNQQITKPVIWPSKSTEDPFMVGFRHSP